MPIVTHSKVCNAYKALDYAMNKPGATVISKTMASDSVADLAREMALVEPFNRDVERTTYHGKLSIDKGMTLSDELWEAIGIDFNDGMGYEEHPFILIRHTDQDHDHVHMIWPRINSNGKCVSDSWDHYKAQTVLREIAERYDLPQIRFSWETIENAPSFAEVHRAEQQQTAYEQGLRDRPADLSVRQQLLNAIKEGVKDQPRLPELIERLQDQGIEVKTDITRPGISFQLQGVKFQGSSLGRGFSFNGLQKHFQVQYDSEQDDARIKELMQRPINTTELNPEREILAESAERNFELVDVPLWDTSEEESAWNTVQKLIEPYQFNIDLIQRLYEESLLATDKKKQLIFGTRTLDDSEKSGLILTPEGSFEEISTKTPESTFWLARNEFIDRTVIVADPLEVIATYSIEEGNPDAANTIYLSATHPDEIPEDLLKQSEKVYLSASCSEDVQAAVRAANPDSRIIDPDHENGWVGQWQLKLKALEVERSVPSSVYQVYQEDQLEL